MLYRLLYWLDLAFGTALMIALAGVLASLWPADAAQAAPVTVSRPVGTFDAVASAGNWELVVHAGSPTAVSITAEPEDAARIDTVVEGGTLQLRPRRGETLVGRGGARIDVTVPALRGLRLSGSGDARVDAMKTPQLAVAIAGAGNARLDAIDADALALHLAGSGDLTAAGSTRRLAVTISGSGDIAADDLAADDVTVRIAGSGDVAVHAQKTLHASIAGSGDVVYRGNPVVQRRIAGSGTVAARR